MAKHQKEPVAGVAFAGTPGELIKLIVTDKPEQKIALEAIINEGPAHKQVYSAMLLKTMFKLVKEIEKQTGEKFYTRVGTLLTSEKDGIEVPVPLCFNYLII